MKKLTKIGVLSLALLAAILMINHTNAATTPANLGFTIIAQSGSCTYPTAWPMGNYNSSLSTFDAMWTTWAFVCTDNAGISGWSMDLLSNNGATNGSTTIAASSVSMSGTLNTATAGCTAGSNTITDTAIATAGTIMKKNWGLNQVCTITTALVRLRVAVPAGATIWTYSGSLTLTIPNL